MSGFYLEMFVAHRVLDCFLLVSSVLSFVNVFPVQLIRGQTSTIIKSSLLALILPRASRGRCFIHFCDFNPAVIGLINVWHAAALTLLLDKKADSQCWRILTFYIDFAEPSPEKRVMIDSESRGGRRPSCPRALSDPCTALGLALQSGSPKTATPSRTVLSVSLSIRPWYRGTIHLLWILYRANTKDGFPHGLSRRVSMKYFHWATLPVSVGEEIECFRQWRGRGDMSTLVGVTAEWCWHSG